jgi:hypothetical protein
MSAVVPTAPDPFTTLHITSQLPPDIEAPLSAILSYTFTAVTYE